jgi:hypothetical protein
MSAFCFLYFIVFLTLHSEVIDYNGTFFVFIYESSVADLYSSRIPDPTKTKEEGKYLLSYLFCSHKFHKIENYCQVKYRLGIWDLGSGKKYLGSKILLFRKSSYRCRVLQKQRELKRLVTLNLFFRVSFFFFDLSQAFSRKEC